MHETKANYIINKINTLAVMETMSLQCKKELLDQGTGLENRQIVSNRQAD